MAEFGGSILRPGGAGLRPASPEILRFSARTRIYPQINPTIPAGMGGRRSVLGLEFGPGTKQAPGAKPRNSIRRRDRCRGPIAAPETGSVDGGSPDRLSPLIWIGKMEVGPKSWTH
jgi:hypothetical protein